LVLNVLWLLLDVANVENLDLIKKLIFVQIVAIELQKLLSHLSEIRKVITERVDELVLVHNWCNNEVIQQLQDRFGLSKIKSNTWCVLVDSLLKD
jgi:hypothetical protein